MSKIDLIFNNKNYSIDDSAIAEASADLKSHLSTVMTGSGATITLGGVVYNIDSTKLSAAEDRFEEYLNGVGGSEEERLEGDGQEFYTLAPTALTFRSTEPLADFQEVKVNGQVVDSSNYTLEEGSTIVNLSIDYLKTLPVGAYDIEVVSANNAPKGGFTVAAPELNEYGFYYNQPYAAYMNYFNSDVVIFIRENNAVDILVVAADVTEIATYTVDDGVLTITSPSMGSLHCTFSTDGMELYNAELDSTLSVNNDKFAADEDYIYIYNNELSGYEVTAINKTKVEYIPIKTGINGAPTVKLAKLMFADIMTAAGNHNMTTSPLIPSTVTIVGDGAFVDCTALTRVVLPDSVTEIGREAFSGCKKLRSITLSSNLSIIKERAFYDCYNLYEVYFAGNLEQWLSLKLEGEYTSPLCNTGTVFYIDNKLIEAVSIPDGTTEIRSWAFATVSSLTTVFIPDSVASIGNYAFLGCSNLTNIAFEGTTEQWSAIEKFTSWNFGVPATHVQCSDGTVAL